MVRSPVSPKRAPTAVLVGRVSVPLPSYGGVFYVLYNRTDILVTPDVTRTATTSMGTAQRLDIEDEQEGNNSPSTAQTSSGVIRSNKCLASSDTFAVSSHLQAVSSRSAITCRGYRGKGVPPKDAYSSGIEKHLVTIHPPYDNLTYAVEDMQNIHALTIVVKATCSVDDDENKDDLIRTLGRVSMWLECVNLSSSSPALLLTVEADVFTAGVSQLSYCAISLPIQPVCTLKTQEAYGAIIDDERSSWTAFPDPLSLTGLRGGYSPCLLGNRLVVKVPYEINPSRSLVHPTTNKVSAPIHHL
jgi:hypothetical protein